MLEGGPKVHEKPHRHESREVVAERLVWRMERIALAINDAYENWHVSGNKRPGSIVDEQCHVNMRAFTKSKFGGPYPLGASDEVGSIRFNERQVFEKKVAFSGARDPAVQERLGTTDVQKIVSDYEQEQQTRNGSMGEMMMMHLLHKFFGDDFLVVRSSEYDDYENGVDMLVIDHKTGEVLCTFDDIASVNEEDARYKQKREKVERMRNRKGGVRVRYGLTFGETDDEQAELMRTALSNVPLYTLRISPDDMLDFLNQCDFENEKPTEAEMRMLERVLTELEEQEQEQVGAVQDEASSNVARLRASVPQRRIHE